MSDPAVRCSAEPAVERMLAARSAMACWLSVAPYRASRAGPADYLPAQPEFLHFRLAHRRAAVVTCRSALERQSRRRERELLERFLAPWNPRFAVAVRVGAEAGGR